MTGWLLGNMVWASLLMLVVLALRLPAARWLGAGAAYALWLAPALRLVLPPMPALATDVVPDTLLIVTVEEGARAAGQSGSVAPALLLILWAAGALGFGLWQWLAYRAFLTRLSLNSRSIGQHCGVPLIESGAVQGPLALGLLDRRIVVPADFGSRYSDEEQALALEHEAIHHRRGDIWWNHLALLILALNWFNPVAWLAFRAFRADQELACDAAVTAARPAGSRGDYAQALVKSVSPARLITVAPLNQIDQLKRRLKMMNMHRRSSARTAGGVVAVILLAALGAAVGTPGIAHPHPEQGREQRRERIVIRSEHREERGGDAVHRDRREHRIELRDGRGGRLNAEDCGDSERTTVEEGSDGRRSRVVFCARGALSPAQRAEHLRRARDRLAGDSALSAEHRSRITAALDREIARLRGQ